MPFLIICFFYSMSTAAKPAAPKQAKAPKAKGAVKEKKEKTERRLGVTVKDVASDLFIKEYAAYLKKAGKLRTPKWVDYVKTGINRELSPLDPDWLYVRAGKNYGIYFSPYLPILLRVLTPFIQLPWPAKCTSAPALVLALSAASTVARLAAALAPLTLCRVPARLLVSC